MSEQNKRAFRGNYRRVWEESCCKIPEGFVIHHIDHDRGNNEIENLIMMPGKLHSRYHYYKMITFAMGAPRFDICDCAVGGFKYGRFWLEPVEEYVEILEEISIWNDYKAFLLGILPNIHNISLEGYSEDKREGAGSEWQQNA